MFCATNTDLDIVEDFSRVDREAQAVRRARARDAESAQGYAGRLFGVARDRVDGTFTKAALKHRSNLPTAFDVLVASNKFSTLIRILKAVGLEDQLKSSASLTMFTPNDAAFAKPAKAELDRSTATGEPREDVRHRLLRHFVAADLVDLTRLTAFDSLARPTHDRRTLTSRGPRSVK